MPEPTEIDPKLEELLSQLILINDDIYSRSDAISWRDDVDTQTDEFAQLGEQALQASNAVMEYWEQNLKDKDLNDIAYGRTLDFVCRELINTFQQVKFREQREQAIKYLSGPVDQIISCVFNPMGGERTQQPLNVETDELYIEIRLVPDRIYSFSTGSGGGNVAFLPVDIGHIEDRPIAVLFGKVGLKSILERAKHDIISHFSELAVLTNADRPPGCSPSKDDPVSIYFGVYSREIHDLESDMMCRLEGGKSMPLPKWYKL